MKRKKKIWKWVILGIPVSFIVIGIIIVSIFGWEMTKQTTLLAKSVVVPYKPKQDPIEFSHEAWSKLPAPGEQIGTLSIPSIDLAYPVVQGTHDNELKHGIGHFAGSMLPGQDGHVLLSGHRDTTFRALEHLEIGDEITFTTPYGDFVYKTTEFEVVPADDRTVNVPTDYETLTLTTCYPFNFIGNAPDRFVVFTELVHNPLETNTASKEYRGLTPR